MKTKILLTVLLGGSLCATGALAQKDPSLYSRYCLRDSDAGTVTCAYASFRQCMAARTASIDDCVKNPRLVSSRR
ncbi:MAG: DUF3551 domain-containing protein [Pseudorhodoplanes sp.]|nr:DUF3551 domain-containing protein [Pseudorhodoplanes sp.]